MLSRIMRPPSPAFVISIIALFFAVSGGAFAIAASDNSKDKKIAKKVVNKLAPGLSVKHAGSADSATNADQATNANNATNADHATNADNATNASHLGGSPPSAFQGACKLGAVAAHVYLKGSATFSATYTSANPPLQDQFNCTGGVVEAKRTGTGVYRVHFGGLDNGSQLIAVGNQSVTSAGVAVAGGEVTFKLLADSTVNGGAGGTVYQVTEDDTAGNPVDNEFSFALLSPQ